MFIRKTLQTILLTVVILITNGIASLVFAVSFANTDQPSSPDSLWEEIRQDLVIHFDNDNPAVKKQIAWYQKHPRFLYTILSRSRDLLQYVHTQTKDRGLPAEIALIPIIESHYNPNVYAKSGAGGLWQMMPRTARKYGLKVNKTYDARKDVVASTQAAMQYMNYLYHYFNGNWLLALAAYELGEAKVKSIAWRQENYDFWTLSLPKHTRTYVPKLLAIAAIIKDPEQYNLSLPMEEHAHSILSESSFKAAVGLIDQSTYKIQPGDNLVKIAKKFHMSLSQLKEMNPNVEETNLRPGQKINLISLDEA